MQPALDLLERAGGELSFEDLLNQVAYALNIDDAVARSRLASGRETQLENNLRWALSYLAAAGKLQVSGNRLTGARRGRIRLQRKPAAV
jgi:restriction endonuclease Mrr